MPALIFLSYAPEDTAHRDALEKHIAPLERGGLLQLWHDGQLQPGENRKEAKDARLDEAAAVLLLVSADYLASEVCRDEMTRALRRAQTRDTKVIPVLLRPCLAKRDAVAGLEILPSDGRPVTTWASADAAWANVAAGVCAVLEGRGPSRRRRPGASGALSKEATASAQDKASRPSGKLRRPPNDETINLLAKLEDTRVRKRRLEEAGAPTRTIDAEIVALKRKLREGGQVGLGDLIAGRYSLLQYIGDGGFATLWEAEDRIEQRRVALKVLHTNLAADPERSDRFFRGARVMSDLDHPAVVRIFDPHIEDQGYCCFAMELVRGKDLQQTVIAGLLPPERVIPLILHVGDALSSAHAKGYTHRDVKPSNILLGADGSVKLTDFDLVRDLNTSGGTRSGGAMGTYGYAAPEALSNPQVADARSDIFSLGMTALFCLAWVKRPDALFHHREKVLAQFDDKQVGAVLRRAIELDPADRFQDMSSFCEALRAAAMEDGTEPQEAAAPQETTALQETTTLPIDSGTAVKPRRSMRAWALWAAGLCALGAAVWGARQRSQPLVGAETILPSCPAGMIPIPGGTFTMGSSPDDRDAYSDEAEHEVMLSPYCIDRTEVTVAAYAECAAREQNNARCPPPAETIRKAGDGGNIHFWSGLCNGTTKDAGGHPVNCVDWSMADTFCRWAGKRLPTEAQWEYAARGTTGRRYPWGNDAPGPERLNACGLECREMAETKGQLNWEILYEGRDPWPMTAPAGALEGDESAFGLRDMGGNVMEWVADWHANYDLSISLDPVNATQSSASPLRVIRGGSWYSERGRQLRAANRWRDVEELRSFEVGFRCASPPSR